ncbi:MAG: DUF6371 domain-containing protein [Balneolales bacterium]
MENFKYILDPGSRKFICPSCEKKRFVRYIDSQTNNYVDGEFGRCDREENCGYHLDPFKCSSFITLGNMNVNTPKRPSRQVKFIPYETFHKSRTGYDRNNFIQYLLSLFAEETVNQLIATYHIGTSKQWNGANVFWQVDIKNRIRTGRIMFYDPQTGKRDKNKNHWVHSLLYSDFPLRQCYFGEHLLSDANKPIAIVESAKTAIIASAYFPSYTWLGCDGSNGLMPATHNKHEVLRGRKVTLFPDVGKMVEWSAKAEQLKNICNVNVSELLEQNAPTEHKGYDIADYLTGYDLSDFTGKAKSSIREDRKPQGKYRAYPTDWDIEPPPPGTDEYMEMINEERKAA